MIGIGATIGKVSISKNTCSCNQQINAIVPKAKLVNSYFLVSYLQSLKHYILTCGKFTTLPIINQDETKRLPICYPPLVEQFEIARYIEKGTNPFKTAITRTEREIALMQEYRTRLVSDVVTGKLDVRGAAAALPDVLIETTTEVIEEEADLDTEELEA